jgi:hypothetical protein
MSITKTLAVLLLAGAVVSCSPRDFLKRRLAADLITSSEAFHAQQVFWLKTGMVSNDEFNSPESLVLQRNGWTIGNPQKKCPEGLEPAPCWEVLLSPHGVETFSPLIHSAQPTSELVPVQVARRELVEVTGISKSGNTAEVEFTWHWVALNEVGRALYDSGVRYRSHVGFRSYDDGWRVQTEPIHASQPLDEALRTAQPVQ